MINTMFRNDDAMMTPIFLLFHIMHPKKRQTLFHKNVLQRERKLLSIWGSKTSAIGRVLISSGAKIIIRESAL